MKANTVKILDLCFIYSYWVAPIVVGLVILLPFKNFRARIFQEWRIVLASLIIPVPLAESLFYFNYPFLQKSLSNMLFDPLLSCIIVSLANFIFVTMTPFQSIETRRRVWSALIIVIPIFTYILMPGLPE